MSNLITGQFYSATLISNKGTVKVINVGAYWDQNCSNRVYSINWGTLELGSSRNVTIFIKNEGNDVITLFLLTENWDPQNASSFITLEWDYHGKALNPEEIIQVTLNLHIALNTTGIESFSFDIIIGAVGSE